MSPLLFALSALYSGASVLVDGHVPQHKPDVRDLAPHSTGVLLFILHHMPVLRSELRIRMHGGTNTRNTGYFLHPDLFRMIAESPQLPLPTMCGSGRSRPVYPSGVIRVNYNALQHGRAFLTPL